MIWEACWYAVGRNALEHCSLIYQFKKIYIFFLFYVLTSSLYMYTRIQSARYHDVQFFTFFLASPAEPKIIKISSNTMPGVLLVTWEPNYNGGSSQHFLVYLLNLTVWNLVANTTDSDATIEYSEASGPEEAVAVMACNTHGCSRPAKLIRGLSRITTHIWFFRPW